MNPRSFVVALWSLLAALCQLIAQTPVAAAASFHQGTANSTSTSSCFLSPSDTSTSLSKYQINFAEALQRFGEPAFQASYNGSVFVFNPCRNSGKSVPAACGKSTVCVDTTISGNGSQSISYGENCALLDPFRIVCLDKERLAELSLICNRKIITPRLEVVKEDYVPNKKVHLELIGQFVCSFDPDTVLHTRKVRTEDSVNYHEISPGSIILIISFTIFGVYFLGGILIRKFVGGADGYEVIPNYAFWSDLPILIKDGTMYLVGGCRPEVVYDAI